MRLVRKFVCFAICLVTLNGCSSPAQLSQDQKTLRAAANMVEAMKEPDSDRMRVTWSALSHALSQQALSRRTQESCSREIFELSESIKIGSLWYRKWVDDRSVELAEQIKNVPNWLRILIDEKKLYACKDQEFSILVSEASKKFKSIIFEVHELYPEIEKQDSRTSLNQPKAGCSFADAFEQMVFERFVLLEDARGKDNEQNEAYVAQEYGISVQCVRMIMIRGLEIGRPLPEPL